MKKALALLLAFAFALGLSLGVIAEEEVLPHIYMKTALNDAQNNLTVELYTDGKKWTALDFGLKFDPAALNLESVNVGSKILTAIDRGGYDFITMHRDIAESNSAGFCNFVAAVGNETCNMTRYAGPVAVFTFSVKDLTKARASLDICLATMVDKDGNALLDYTSYGPSDPPVAYESHQVDLFRYGDLNRDGKITIFDATLIMRSLVGMTELNERQSAAALVSGRAQVSVFDATLIMRYLVGMIDSFPVES
ncbi:MAG: dockerin type I repeat-containing protein [Clostridia bacterium]|nr:dockerin type I repeat-containing protein [Clostridia bacterium]